jgi:hypothetical protein
MTLSRYVDRRDVISLYYASHQHARNRRLIRADSFNEFSILSILPATVIIILLLPLEMAIESIIKVHD